VICDRDLAAEAAEQAVVGKRCRDRFAVRERSEPKRMKGLPRTFAVSNRTGP